MTKDTDTALDAEEIEITPEMIEAGVLAFLRHDRRFEEPDEAVRRIYSDMWRVSELARF